VRYEVRVGERTVHVEIGPDGSTLVDDVAIAVEARPIGTAAWWLTVGGASHEVRVLAREPLRLWVDGRELPASVADERALAADRSAGRTRAERDEVRAPMPGLLRGVHVSEGDVVERGAPLATLEAMKMENELRAPSRGRVIRVAAAAGSKVEAGALLVVVGPE